MLFACASGSATLRCVAQLRRTGLNNAARSAYSLDLPGECRKGLSVGRRTAEIRLERCGTVCVNPGVRLLVRCWPRGIARA